MPSKTASDQQPNQEPDPTITDRIVLNNRLALASLEMTIEDLQATVAVAEALANGTRIYGQLVVEDRKNFAPDAPHELRSACVHLETRLFR